jgi:hypothetical protein
MNLTASLALLVAAVVLLYFGRGRDGDSHRTGANPDRCLGLRTTSMPLTISRCPIAGFSAEENKIAVG